MKFPLLALVLFSGCSSPHRAFVSSVPTLNPQAERRVCYGEKLIVLRERWPSSEGDNWAVRFYRKTDHANIYQFHYVISKDGSINLPGSNPR